MRRYEVTDEHWTLMEPLLPGREGDPGAHGADNRLFVNAVIWIARTGAPWRDLPERFGEWNSVYQCSVENLSLAAERQLGSVT